MEEDYVQLPPPRQQGAHGSALGHGAIGALPASYPTPLSRLIFRDLKLLITLNEEEERSSESGGTGVSPQVQQLSCMLVATVVAQPDYLAVCFCPYMCNLTVWSIN